MFLKHPAWLWLKKHQKNMLPLVDENTQAIFDTGHLFEEYAEQLFPDGVRVGFETAGDNSYFSMPLRTKQAIENSAKTIFQGRFEFGELTCIFDVISRANDEEFDLYEIKSSTSVKDEHILDLSFQLHVIESVGLKIRNIFVIHVNTEYKRNGEIKVEEITSVADVTKEVRKKTEETKENIKEALKMMKSANPPSFSPRHTKGMLRDWMEIYRFIYPDLDKYSIYNLSKVNTSLIGELEDLGINSIGDIPDSVKLTSRQKFQRDSVKKNKTHVNKEKIKEFLDAIKYPLYFLDYETLSSVIPVFDGLSPFQQLPFQYSLHILEKPGGELKHKEYLHKDQTHPAQPLLKKLKEDIGSEGTILVWYEPFEKGRNTELGELFPEYKDFMEGVNVRIIDLMTPFSDDWFVDKDFLGSASIKKVLPVLVPELSYKDLDIQEGGSAQRIWMETVLNGKNKDKRDKIMNDLIEYCKLDTLAMVKIFEDLQRVIVDNVVR